MDAQRLKELFRYFKATSKAVTSKIYDIDSPQGCQPEAAYISTDPVLNGLTQLGACRTNADRAFVSLIDDEHQFLVAEMTTSVSLLETSHHAENDGVAFGVRSLNLQDGICAGTMPAFFKTLKGDEVYRRTSNIFANSSRYVINDLALEEQYGDKPYVMGHPHMRYYAEVPIRSASGFVLGTYAIVRKQPGNGLSEEHYRILHETSVAIMQHLEMIRLREEHDHAKRLLRGLNAFVQCQPDLSKATIPQNAAIEDLRSPLASQDESNQPVVNYNLHLSTSQSSLWEAPEPSDPIVNFGNDLVPHSTTRPPLTDKPQIEIYGKEFPSEQTNLTSHASSARSISPTGLANKNGQKPENSGAAKNLESSVVTTSSDRLFMRAADLLRDAMELDGVVFLDTAFNKFTKKGSVVIDADSKVPWNSADASSDPNSTIETPQITRHRKNASWSSNHNRSPLCKSLGYSTKVSSRAAKITSASDHPSIPEVVHHELLKLCNEGQVFNFTLGPHTSPPVSQPSHFQSDWPSSPRDSSSTDSTSCSGSRLERLKVIEEVLRRYLPEARAIVFVPLRNPHTGKWFAGSLGWSKQKRRILESSDLSYFAVFGNSLMAEVARLELQATDRAKSDFISCMSHELRSPLHGILGSTELLMEYVTDSDQSQYVSMIGKCGRILLETMENILQYSKINRGASDQELTGRQLLIGDLPHEATVRVSGAQSDLDLSDLVEEVCEVLVAGDYINALSLRSGSDRKKEGSSSVDSNRSPQPHHTVIVILSIDPRCTDLIRSSSAAWRRCLLNLLGNALKYTTTGYVEVDLRRVTTEKNEAASSRTVSLAVRDTGPGIGKAFLESQLFRPFVQENPLSTGTGLGLSIVKNLVDDLGGAIEVQSELGVGTEITISMSTKLADMWQGAEQPSPHKKFSEMTVQLLGFDRETIPDGAVNGSSSVFDKSSIAIKKSLSIHCEQWFNMTCFQSQGSGTEQADILAITESNLQLLQDRADSAEYMIVVPPSCMLLVLCLDHHIHHPSYDHKSKGRIAFLAQPFGPRKLASILEEFLRVKQNNDSSFTQQLKLNLSDLMAQSIPGKPSSKIDSATTSVLPIRNGRTPQGTITREDDDSNPRANSTHQATQEPKHLLVVDDNAINLKLIVQSVRKLGCTYEVATNGLEAFEVYKASTKPFDFVFMDISMPIMDGFESTRAIRAFEAQEGREHAYIIALTGLGSKSARLEADASGFSLFWTKPVKLNTIKAVVEADDLSTFSLGS